MKIGRFCKGAIGDMTDFQYLIERRSNRELRFARGLYAVKSEGSEVDRTWRKIIIKSKLEHNGVLENKSLR